MRSLLNGRKLLAAAFVGLAGLAGAMMLSQNSQQSSRAATVPVNATETASEKNSAARLDTVTATARTDSAPSDDPFVIKRVLPIDGPIKYGEWHWDDGEVPDGPIVITVDLEARVLSIFRGGYEIGATAVLLGTEEKPTPTGVFPITQKKRHHISNLYDAPMPYMQRLTDDGITLHASEVEWGYASHGCIAMPEPFAAKVFAQTDIGDRVFVTRGKTIGMGDSLVGS